MFERALVLTYCPDPDCYAPAEVADEYLTDSTSGPVLHRITVCVRRHRYVTVLDITDHTPEPW